MFDEREAPDTGDGRHGDEPGPADGAAARPLELDDASAEELRQLLGDLREAASEGRFLARRYADLLCEAVDQYCSEFDQRAETVLRRLERVK